MSSKDILLNRINNNPIFQIEDGNERLKQRVNYINLQRDLMDYKGFLKQIHAQIDQNGDLKPEVIEDEDNVYHSGTEEYEKLLSQNLQSHEKVYVYGIFEDSLKKAVKKYNPQKGIFIGYFNTTYRRAVEPYFQKELRIYNGKTSISNHAQKQLGQVMKELGELQKTTGSDKVEQFIPEIATTTGIAEDKVSWLIRMNDQIQSLEEMTTEKSSWNSEEDSLIDFQDEDNTEDSSSSDVIIQTMITFITTAGITVNTREYYKLFLTNDALIPLKKEYSEIPNDSTLAVPADYQNHMEHKEILENMADSLFESVFEPPYLSFVFEQPPKPDSIQHIDECGFNTYVDPDTQETTILRLQDKTIGFFKNAKASYVSRMRKKYKGLQELARRYYHKEE